MPDTLHACPAAARCSAPAPLLAAPALLTRRAAAAETCVVGTWGGDYARLLRENIDDPILKPAGRQRHPGRRRRDAPRYAKMTAQKQCCRMAPMDIACFGAVNGYRATEAGLVDPLDETKVPNLKHVLPESARDRLSCRTSTAPR